MFLIGQPYSHLIEWKQLQNLFQWQTIFLIGPVIAMGEAFDVQKLFQIFYKDLKQKVFF